MYRVTTLKKLAPRLFAKCEFEQPTSSFKIRPAYRAIQKNLEQAKRYGVLAASSGNFAQAVAYVCRKLGIRCRIVMTSRTSPFKLQMTQALGAEVLISGDSFESREALSRKLREESPVLFLHPFDSLDTMEGDATMAEEILDQINDDFDIYVPTSGGGLLAATAERIKRERPRCRVFGVQQRENFSLESSFRKGERVKVAPFQSICDSLVAVQPGEKTFPIILKFVDDVMSPTEDEIKRALRDLWDLFGLMVEPGSATAYAAYRRWGSRDRNSILVLSGSNIDDRRWHEIVESIE